MENNSSKLLIDESPLQVLPTLACKLGLSGAIITQQIHYWLKISEKANKQESLYDSRWWVYNNYKDWQAQNFPFWSVSTVRTVIAELEKIGVLITREEVDRKSRGGSRKWYTIDYDKLNTLLNEETEQTVDQKVADPSAKKEQTPIYIDTESPTDTKDNGAKKPRQRDPLFDLIASEFWGITATDTQVIPGARIGWIVSHLKGNDVTPKGRETIPGCNPPATLEEVAKFARTIREIELKDVQKFAERFLAWRQTQHSTPSTPPPPHEDLCADPLAYVGTRGAING